MSGSEAPGHPPGNHTAPSRRRVAAVYVAITVVGLLALALVLPAGSALSPPDPGVSHSAGASFGEEGAAGGLDGEQVFARLLLAAAAVVGASRAVGWLFVRIRQPRVLGEIVAGILLGPSLLGAVLPAASAYLFPVPVTDALQVLARFGLILFMFLVGLELRPRLLRGAGVTAALVSHASMVAPFVLGLGVALVAYPLVGSGTFTSFALFLGAAMAVTAFPVLARILADTGLARTRVGALAITCAAVDDVSAWCVLSVVVAVAQAGTTWQAVQAVVLTGVFAVVMILVVRPLAGRLPVFRRPTGAEPADRTGPSSAVITVLIIGLLLGAWVGEQIGVHAIFGAFLAGAVVPHRRWLVDGVVAKLEPLTGALLLPMFFATVGLVTRIDLLDRPQLWALAGLVLAAAVAGKWGAASLAARFAGQPWREAGVLGALMNTRGLTEIVILSVGRSIGVVSPELFAVMVLMALTTTFMATPAVALLRARSRDPVSLAGSGSIGPGGPFTAARLAAGVGVDTQS